MTTKVVNSHGSVPHNGVKFILKEHPNAFLPGDIHKRRGVLELPCCKKRQKSPNQETGLGNRGHLKVLNDTKLILNGHE